MIAILATMDLNKIERMDLLIRTNATGAPKAFAKSLSISTRTLYNYIRYMRNNLGAPIVYSHSRQSYIYLEPGEVKVGWYKK